MSYMPAATRSQSRILPLSSDAIAQVQSSKQISSLQGVVLSLLENSLDAGATKVDISVCLSRGSCSVEDNGSGIPQHEFLDRGGLGKLYHTSKATLSDALDVHGSTGTFLASLAALSLLSITSRHADSTHCATLSLHQGRAIAREVPSPPLNELTMYESHGTRVAVNDLFGNMPVRVKQRALSSDAGSGPVDKVWQELKYGIASLLLFWRSPCSVKIRDADNSGRNITLAASHPAVSAALTEKSLNLLAGKTARFDLRDALPVVFQAGFAAFETRSRWVPVSASSSKLSIRGLICPDPAPIKACQFVGLGIQPCAVAQGHSAISEFVNKLFANSSFGSNEEAGPVDEAEKDRRKQDHRYKADGYTQRQTRASKGVDRWPMYVLQVTLKEYETKPHATSHPSDSQLKSIIDVLEAMITQWLAAHNYRPKKKRKRAQEGQQSPSPLITSRLHTSLAQGRPSTSSPDLDPLHNGGAGNNTVHGKRRHLPGPGDNPGKTGLAAPASYIRSAGLGAWSRIKSGGRSLFGDDFQSRKLASTPTTTSTRDVESVNRPPVGGTRSSNNIESDRAPRNATQLDQRHAEEEVEAQSLRSDLRISSDYFGSVDEADLLAAADVQPEGQGHGDGFLGSPQDAKAAAPDTAVQWTDPVTKQVFRVNTRTGVVLPAETGRPQTGGSTTPNRRSAAIDTATTSAGRPLTLSKRALGTPDQSENLVRPSFLRDWQNPVFPRKAEEQIPVASIDGPGMLAEDVVNRRCTHHELTDAFAASANSNYGKISKEAIRRARVIRQVDAKFIICSMPLAEGPGGRRLVLIDQHAASERILLEQLFTELCTPAVPGSSGASIRTNTGCASSVLTTPAEQPLHLEVTREEYELFQLHATHFARWGVLYDLTNGAETLTSSQVRPARHKYKLVVRALPPGIAERCRLFPKLLIELLRSEIWSLASSSRRDKPQDLPPNSVEGPDDHPNWLRRLGSCPKGIIDMLNSRACRSAVMFNDVLSTRQCQDLLGQLSECVFPFMCAHGRVSMVPLVELGGEGSGFGVALAGLNEGLVAKEEGFVSAFKRWKGRVRGVGSDENEV